MAGRGPSADRKHGFAIGQQIGMSDGVAVDRAVGVWRQVHRRDEIAGENPAAGAGTGDRLGLDDRRDALVDPASAASTLSRAPPKAKQSSLSWAIVTLVRERG